MLSNYQYLGQNFKYSTYFNDSTHDMDHAQKHGK